MGGKRKDRGGKQKGRGGKQKGMGWKKEIGVVGVNKNDRGGKKTQGSRVKHIVC